MAAEQGAIEPGDVVAVAIQLWAGGPIRDLRARGCSVREARVVAIDMCGRAASHGRERQRGNQLTSRRRMSTKRLMEMTKGRGPDCCNDRVGAEAHGGGSLDAIVDNAKASIGLTSDSACPGRGDHVLPQGRDHLDPRCLFRLA